MLELHYWPTPNGWKITIFLEETGLPYQLVPVDIGRGEQFAPSFLAISPNNRMPAIVDPEPADGGPPISVFESAAILTYLAEKTGKLMPSDVRGRTLVQEWLVWQVANLGPVSGQAGHFILYAPEKFPYAIDRFRNETHRLYGVMNARLASHAFLAGDYSIADIACWPWLTQAQRYGHDLAAEFPHLSRWFEEIGARPAVQKGKAVGRELVRKGPLDEESRKHLFGQRAR